MRPTSPDDLFAYLAHLGIAQSTERHLFLKDRKGGLFLVTAKDDTRIDLKRLPEAVGAAGRLSFGSCELLLAALGVEPGSVTPLGAINDRPPRVKVILDRRLMAFGRVNVHPLVNTMTTGLSPGDLVAFLRATDHDPAILDLPEPIDRADADGD